MKHFVKKNPNDFRECFEPCPFMNSTELLEIYNKTVIVAKWKQII